MARHFASLFTIIAAAALLPVAVQAQTVIPGVYSQCVKPGHFALTFDDGPSQYTSALLHLLDQEKVPATFFVLGENAAKPALQPFILDAYTRGHQIGVHTYTHPNLTSVDAAKVRDEMERTDTVLRQMNIGSPYYMRPPYGEVGAESLQVIKGEMDYVIVQWNLDSNDWRVSDKPAKFSDVAKAFTRALGAATATPTTANFVSLQHDTLEFSVTQTRDIVNKIREKGFEFVTVDVCLGSPKPQYRNTVNGVFRAGIGAASAVPAAPAADASMNPLTQSQKTRGDKPAATGASSAASTVTAASSWVLAVTATFALCQLF